MFSRIGRAVSHQPASFVIGWVLLVAVAVSLVFQGWGAGGLFQRLASGDATTPDTESSVVADLTRSDEDAGEVISIVVDGVDVVGDPAGAGLAATSARGSLGELEGVASVTDAFALPDPTSQEARALLSTGGDGYVVIVTLDADLSEQEVASVSERVAETAEGAYVDSLHTYEPRAEAYAVSSELIGDSIGELVQRDLAQGESVSLPVALILLVIIFGGLLAAGLPLVNALASIVIGMAALWGLTFVLEVQSFILNVISILGLALSIDYGLLFVSRYREEVAAQLARAGYGAAMRAEELPVGEEMNRLVRVSVQRTVATAGRTVSFSALTIACSIAGLLVMSSPMLKTIATGAIAVALVAVLCTITLVPAVITLLGGRLVRPSVLSRVPGVGRVLRAIGDASSEHGVFSRLSNRVVAHPWIVMGAIAAVLAVMVAPIGSARMRTNIIEYVPQDAPVRTGYDVIQDDYPALATPTISVVAQAGADDANGLVSDIQALDDVARVTAEELSGQEGMTLISVLMDVEDPVGPQASDAVETIRGMEPGYEYWVGGAAAQQEDFIDSMAERAPWAALIVITAVFLLLFCMTGSLVVPLKALLINSVSLIASLGVTSWLFEHGRLGLPQTPGLQTFVVACLMAFGFGLAMDYEVFLLARINEYWEAGHDNDDAVARGLQRSGRIITSAAVIIIAVFLGFVSGEMISIKELGVGLAVMVAVDATLVRLLLVPATMTVLGRWNWWAPRPLAHLYQRFRQQV
ncbi:MMPL family transporter [Actinomyces ruminicola]|uniref:Putative drug exporter of the RND superfamily n=1 Tax=Actinomyces ruminicola TaxID=332524 RepID=A0A1G9V6R1_9ACTO|nr:MMPL family transporter [Actinomyces ruminicola]SDM67878.1 putative drug exporter of the RND superfamily [Actinomyces ruminicola]